MNSKPRLGRIKSRRTHLWIALNFGTCHYECVCRRCRTTLKLGEHPVPIFSRPTLARFFSEHRNCAGTP